MITVKTKPDTIQLKQCNPGTFAVDNDGRVWLRTQETATCLSSYPRTYPRVEHATIQVTPLKAGDVITITVE